MLLKELMGRSANGFSGSLGKSHRMPGRIAHDLALRYVADIAPPKGELHNALALAGKQCPARSSLRVLFDAVNVIGEVIEPHRAEFLGPCRRNKVRLPLQP